jgi:hypothetical protein
MCWNIYLAAYPAVRYTSLAGRHGYYGCGGLVPRRILRLNQKKFVKNYAATLGLNNGTKGVPLLTTANTRCISLFLTAFNTLILLFPFSTLLS